MFHVLRIHIIKCSTMMYEMHEMCQHMQFGELEAAGRHIDEHALQVVELLEGIGHQLQCAFCLHGERSLVEPFHECNHALYSIVRGEE